MGVLARAAATAALPTASNNLQVAFRVCGRLSHRAVWLTLQTEQTRGMSRPQSVRRVCSLLSLPVCPPESYNPIWSIY